MLTRAVRGSGAGISSVGVSTGGISTVGILSDSGPGRWFVGGSVLRLCAAVGAGPVGIVGPPPERRSALRLDARFHKPADVSRFPGRRTTETGRGNHRQGRHFRRTGAAILGATAEADRGGLGAESIIGAMLRAGALARLRRPRRRRPPAG